MEETELAISNVKLSCTIRLLQAANISFHTDKKIKFYPNFCTVQEKYSYIIFTKPGAKKSFHVNITKIPNFEHIDRALIELADVIKESYAVERIRVENVTCTYHAPFIVNLKQLFYWLNSGFHPDICNLTYSPEKFPGMFFKLKPCTILLFSNGKIVVIGASNKEDARKGISYVLGLVQNLQTSKSSGR